MCKEPEKLEEFEINLNPGGDGNEGGQGEEGGSKS